VTTGFPLSMAALILWMSSKFFCPDRIRDMADNY
jgi:hypothetical protein